MAQTYNDINQGLVITNTIYTITATASLSIYPATYVVTNPVTVTLPFACVPSQQSLGFGATLGTSQYDNSGALITIISACATGSVTVAGGTASSSGYYNSGYVNQTIAGAATLTVATQSAIQILGIGAGGTASGRVWEIYSRS